MDEKTLIISCVEYFSHLKNIPGNKVFQSFQQNAILDLLQQSHTNFPEMDLDFYAGMVDGMLLLESDAKENDYAHYKERTSLILEVVSMLIQKDDLTLLDACTTYYKSETAKKVSEDSNAFYQKSAEELYALLQAE